MNASYSLESELHQQANLNENYKEKRLHLKKAILAEIPNTKKTS